MSDYCFVIDGTAHKERGIVKMSSCKHDSLFRDNGERIGEGKGVDFDNNDRKHTDYEHENK
jgi:hypothetical protein